jgi:hypothetical protein
MDLHNSTSMYVALSFLFLVLLSREGIGGENQRENNKPPILRDEKILLLVPGINFDHDRLLILFKNLRLLMSLSEVDLDCLIFAYRSPPIEAVEEEFRRLSCQMEYFYHGNYAFYLKAAVPSLLIASGYSHVFVLLDDVELSDSFR